MTDVTKPSDPPLMDAGFVLNEPIKRRTLHEQVTERVRDMIIEGALSPGERIFEASLVKQLGVSRTPLREALRTLAAENLIDLHPSRGAVVRKLTADDVFAMLELLAELEHFAGRLVCQRASDDEIADVLSIHDRMMALYEKRDRLNYYKANQDIHTSMARLSGNPTLFEMHQRIQSRLKRIRFIGNGTPEKWAGAVAQHEVMAEALRERDAGKLSAVLHEHIMSTWHRVRDAI